MNKRGEEIHTEKTVWILMFAFVPGILFLAFAFITSTYIGSVYSFPEGLRSIVITERFEPCFGEKNTIELSRFTQAQLNECYPVKAESNAIALRMSLTLDQQPHTYTTQNWKNERVTDRIITRTINVLDNGIKTGTLRIEVQNE